jgi:hypothetical protein
MLQHLRVANPKHILQHFAEKALSQAISTQAPATPPNEKVLLFLLLQRFCTYGNTFRVLEQVKIW